MTRKVQMVGLYRDAEGCSRAWFVRGLRYASYDHISLVSAQRLQDTMRELRYEFVFMPYRHGWVGWVAERRRHPR